MTETCRQLRSEFLPIHQARVKVSIRLEDIEQYCHHILRHQHSALVRITSEVWSGCCDRADDITELVRLVDRNPGIVLIRYRPYITSAIRLTNRIQQGQVLRNIVEQTDKVFVTRKILWTWTPGARRRQKIGTIIAPEDPNKYGQLWLQIKPEYAEPWMAKSLRERYTDEEIRLLFEWQLKLGMKFQSRSVLPYCPKPIGDSHLSACS